MTAYSAFVAPDLSQLARLRHELAEWFDAEHLDPALQAELVLATHEAVANAIEHTDPPAPVAVEATLGEGEITIDVTNHGPWLEDGPSDVTERGRGLNLIRALADDVEIRAGAGAVTVSVRRSLSRPRYAAPWPPF